MSYQYETEKRFVFTDEGQRQFLRIRDRVNALLKQAGAVTMGAAISGETGSTWEMMACVDRMVELTELRELTNPSTARVSTACSSRDTVTADNPTPAASAGPDFEAAVTEARDEVWEEGMRLEDNSHPLVPPHEREITRKRFREALDRLAALRSLPREGEVELLAQMLYERDESQGGPPVKAWENVGREWQEGWRGNARTILARLSAHRNEDGERLDALEEVICGSAEDGWVEVYLSGLRRGVGPADGYQVETNPNHLGTVDAPTLREAIDKFRALVNLRSPLPAPETGREAVPALFGMWVNGGMRRDSIAESRQKVQQEVDEFNALPSGERMGCIAKLVELWTSAAPPLPAGRPEEGPLDGVWPEELRPAMLVIEEAQSYARSLPLAEQGRITDAFTALKEWMRKARRALRSAALPAGRGRAVSEEMVREARQRAEREYEEDIRLNGSTIVSKDARTARILTAALGRGREGAV